MYKAKLSSAFTMIELIFVIVILGIVASIGSELIAKVYESYIIQRATHRATLKTELAATQIANRLAAAIPGTIYRKDKKTSPTAIEALSSQNMGLGSDAYKVLQWVGADVESFNDYNSSSQKSGWSGFCDLDASTKTRISSPGSDFTIVDNIRGKFGNTHNYAIFFPYDSSAHYGTTDGSDNSVIVLSSNVSHIVEHYKLARTSYALVCENGSANYCGDLTLYYNFLPTPKIDIPSTASRSVLAKRVTTFKFKGAGRTIRFKICKQESIGDENITACKEKAVF